MALGFIVLRDGRCQAVRWPLHDPVLRSIARALPPGDSLREWLLMQAPRDGDIELGYDFVRASDEVHVSRCIDTRCMTPETQRRAGQELDERRVHPRVGWRNSEQSVERDVAETAARSSDVAGLKRAGPPSPNAHCVRGFGGQPSGTLADDAGLPAVASERSERLAKAGTGTGYDEGCSAENVTFIGVAA